MQEVGSSLDPERHRSWSLETLDTFIQAILSHVRNDDTDVSQSAVQDYWDLTLLLQISKTWGEPAAPQSSLLQEHIAQLREQVSVDLRIALPPLQ